MLDESINADAIETELNGCSRISFLGRFSDGHESPLQTGEWSWKFARNNDECDGKIFREQNRKSESAPFPSRGGISLVRRRSAISVEFAKQKCCRILLSRRFPPVHYVPIPLVMRGARCKRNWMQSGDLVWVYLAREVFQRRLSGFEWSLSSWRSSSRVISGAFPLSSVLGNTFPTPNFSIFITARLVLWIFLHSLHEILINLLSSCGKFHKILKIVFNQPFCWIVVICTGFKYLNFSLHYCNLLGTIQ